MPFETYTIPTRRENRYNIKEPGVFANEVNALYEDVARRGGKVVFHEMVTLNGKRGTAEPHAVITAELPSPGVELDPDEFDQPA